MNKDWTIAINKAGNVELTLESGKHDLPVIEFTSRKSADAFIGVFEAAVNHAFGVESTFPPVITITKDAPLYYELGNGKIREVSCRLWTTPPEADQDQTEHDKKMDLILEAKRKLQAEFLSKADKILPALQKQTKLAEDMQKKVDKP